MARLILFAFCLHRCGHQASTTFIIVALVGSCLLKSLIILFFETSSDLLYNTPVHHALRYINAGTRAETSSRTKQPLRPASEEELDRPEG